MSENKKPDTPIELTEDQKIGLYNDAYIRLGTLGILNVADLGCGTGPFVKIMTSKKQLPKVYWGVDSDMEKIETARKRFPDWNFAYGDFFSERIRNEFPKHDAFLLLEVLERIENDVELISSIPSGHYIVYSAPSFKVRGALRSYENAEEVKSRYSHLLDTMFKGRFTNPTGEIWFMFITMRR